MKILFGDAIDRNISIQVLMSVMVVIISVGSIDLVFSILSELSDVSLSYTFKDVLIYSLLKTPYSLNNLLPYLCLIGTLVGLGSLSDQGEITASKVLGKSNNNILLSALRPVLVVMIIGLASAEFLLPSLSQQAEEDRLIKQDIIKIDQGYWLAGETEFSYFRSTPSYSSIKDITIYSFNSKFQLDKVIKAPKASLIEENWQLEGAEVDKLFEDNLGNLETNIIWSSGPKKDDFSLILSPKYFSLSSLHAQMNKDVSEFRRDLLALEFWRKVLKPVVAIVLIMLAAAFIFGPMRDQKSGQRIFLGIVIAFTVNIIQSLFEGVSVVSNLNPLLAVLIPIFFIYILSVVLKVVLRSDS